MKWTKEAIELMKKFSSGVVCPEWNEDTVGKTMFHPCCEEISQKLGKPEIDSETARYYILMVHNSFTVHVGRLKNESREEIENCMTRPQKKETGWICVHGNAEIMPISQDEAENLERGNQKLLKSL